MSHSAGRQLLFEVGDYMFSADARELRGVLEPLEATPVPGAASGVSGLINLRGQLLVAGVLGPVLGLPVRRSGEVALVVFERDGRQVALEVDRVLGIAPYPTGGPDVPERLLAALQARDVVKGVGHLGARPYYELDVAALIDRVLEPVARSTAVPRPEDTEG